MATGLGPQTRTQPAGSTTVTTTIQAAHDATTSGGVVWIPNGTYNEAVTVTKAITFVGEGPLAVINGGGTRSRWFNVQSHDVTIENLTMQNAISTQHQGGITQKIDTDSGYNNLTVRNCEMVDGGYSGVTLEGGYGHLVERCISRGSAGTGVRVQGVTGATIRKNHLYDNAWQAIYGEQWETAGIKVTGRADVGVPWFTTTNVIIEDNSVWNNRGAGIWVDVNVEGAIIRRNWVHSNRWWGIAYEICWDGLIEDNRVFWNSTRASDSGNSPTFWDAGIMLYNSDNTIVRNNICAWGYSNIIVLRADRPPWNTMQNSRVENNIIANWDRQHSGDWTRYYAKAWLDQHDGALYTPANNNVGLTNSYYFTTSNSWMRFEWDTTKTHDLAIYAATPGESSPTTLTQPQIEAILAANYMPQTPTSDVPDPPPVDDPIPPSGSTEYVVTFTPTDSRSTATDELTWTIRTGSGAAGGDPLASGNATSGVQVTTATIDDTGLQEGENTRYLRITDGALNTLEQSFTVTAVLGSTPHPVEITAVMVTSSSMQAGLAIAPKITAHMAASSTTLVTLTTARQIVALMDSTSAMDVLLGRPIHFTATMAAYSTMNASLTPAAFIISNMVSWSTMQATVTRNANVPQAVMTASSSMNVELRRPAIIEAAMTAESSMSARLAIIPEITATMSSVSTMSALMVAIKDMIVRMHTRSTMQAALVQFIPVVGYGLRIDIHTPAGTKLGPGPVIHIFNARYSGALNELGRFTFTMSATDPMAIHIKSGHEIRVYRDGEGLVYRGIIDRSDITIDDSGRMGLTVAGDSIGRQLVWANTLLGREFSNVTMLSAVNTLLSGSGWTPQSVQSDTRNVTAMFEGASIWQALTHIAGTFGWHVRERNLTRQIDVGKLGAASGLIARNIQTLDSPGPVLPIETFKIQDSQSELWNRVIPIGGGDGINALTIQHSTRTSPYTQQSAIGPGGQYWYLQDNASVAAHGLRVKVISADDVLPLSNSVAEIRNAANTLYDIAAAWLAWHSQQQETYDTTVLGLQHIQGGNPTFRVGETMRVTYVGVIEDTDGRKVWREVDRDLWILGYTRTFYPDGHDEWDFTLSTTDQKTATDADEIAKAIDDVWAIKTSKRPYTYREMHGPSVESIGPVSGGNARLLVDFDSQVLYLHQAFLRVRKRRMKSNITGAASGGGQTSSSGGGQTTSSGGGQTSSSGGAHSHSISSATTPSGGGHTSAAGSAHTHSVSGGTIPQVNITHRHEFAAPQNVTTYVNQPYQQQIVFNNYGTSYGVYVGRGSASPSYGVLTTNNTTTSHSHTISGLANSSESTHRHGVLNHSHSISGQTAATVSNHTHSVQNHTHTVQNHTHTIQDHTHALIYGIFLGPTASAPQFNLSVNGINRTAALGGPWDGDFLVDITQYLTDAQGHVLRQANNIEVTGVQLCDVEMVVKSLVTATSVVPV